MSRGPETFAELLTELERRERAGVFVASPGDGWMPPRWTAGQAFEHCAQSIEYAMTGFPRMNSGLFRATIGRIAAWKFLRKGAMKHSRAAMIPGAPELTARTVGEGLERLRAAIGRFQAYAGPLAPHFALGDIAARKDYERLQVFHVADHLRDWPETVAEVRRG